MLPVFSHGVWRSATAHHRSRWRRLLVHASATMASEPRGQHGGCSATSFQTLGGVCALAAAGGSLFFFQERHKYPHIKCADMQRVKVCKQEFFQEGDMREVKVGSDEAGTALLVHKYQGNFYATGIACSNYGAPLLKSSSTSSRVATRSAPSASNEEIGLYNVVVEDGEVQIEVPSELVAGSASKQVTKPAKRDLKDTRVFALIGSGPASLSAAETLRQEGFGGRIVMITKEPHLPYDRGALSKNLNKTAETLQLRPADFYKQYNIEVIHEAVVTKVDAKSNEMRYTTSTGTQELLKYDKVMVASGGSPRKLFVPGSTLKGIFTLRTPEDAAEITKFARKGRKMIVVGGSFIGMETASSLKSMGCDVSVIAMETVPFERVLGKKVGAAFARLLQKEGVQWYGSAQVRLFRGNDVVNGVELEDGEVLPADGVVIGAGVFPNTRFLEGVPLDKDGAVVVNPLLAAEKFPSFFAAGDVCAFPSARTGSRVRIEHWDIATQQGRVAARNMLGHFQPFTSTPFFWSGLFGKHLRFVGHAPDALDRVIIEGDASGMEFVSYYTQNDEIRAVATVNRDPVAVACAELMRRNKMPKVSELMLGMVNADVLMQRLRDLSSNQA